MMMSIAEELAPEVRVTLVSPGWVRTPMAEQSLQRIGPALVRTLPNQRVADVDDVVNAVLWLASDASSHCIGQDLGVSGGALLVWPRGQRRPARGWRVESCGVAQPRPAGATPAAPSRRPAARLS